MDVAVGIIIRNIRTHEQAVELVEVMKAYARGYAEVSMPTVTIDEKSLYKQAEPDEDIDTHFNGKKES